MHAAVVVGEGHAREVLGRRRAVVEVPDGARARGLRTAEVAAHQAGVGVVHGHARGVHGDGVAEVVGERLVEGAGLAGVDEVGAVLDDAVRHLVADHVEVGGERPELLVAPAVHHLGAVPEGVDEGHPEVGDADQRVDGHAPAVEAVPAVDLLVVVVDLARRPVGVDGAGVGGVLAELRRRGAELLDAVRPAAGGLAHVLAARVPGGDHVLAGVPHPRVVVHDVLAARGVEEQPQLDGGAVVLHARARDARVTPGAPGGLALAGRLRSALRRGGCLGRPEGLDPAVLQDRETGLGVDVHLAQHRRAGGGVAAADGHVVGEHARALGQDDEAAGGAAEGRPAGQCLGVELPARELRRGRADRPPHRQLLAHLGRGVRLQAREVLAGGAGDDALAVLLLHADDVLATEDVHALVLLLQPHDLLAAGSRRLHGLEIAARVGDAITALLVGQMTARGVGRAAARLHALADSVHQGRGGGSRPRDHLGRVRTRPGREGLAGHRRDDEGGGAQQRRRPCYAVAVADSRDRSS